MAHVAGKQAEDEHGDDLREAWVEEAASGVFESLTRAAGVPRRDPAGAPEGVR